MPLGSAIQRNDELFNQDDDEDFISPYWSKKFAPFQLIWNEDSVPFCRNSKILGHNLSFDCTNDYLNSNSSSRSLMITFLRYKNNTFCTAGWFSKQRLPRAYLFQVKKGLFGQLGAFQNKAWHVLTCFKSKRHFLDSWVLFKTNLDTCLHFLSQKGTFWTAGSFSKQSFTRAYLF